MFVVSMLFCECVPAHISSIVCNRFEKHIWAKHLKPSTQHQPLTPGLRVKHHRVIVWETFASQKGIVVIWPETFPIWTNWWVNVWTKWFEPNCCWIHWAKQHWNNLQQDISIVSWNKADLKHFCQKWGAERGSEVITWRLIKQIYSKFLYITFSYKTI